MYQALVACRAGVGSSLMLKIKTEQVIKEEGFPIEVEHSSLDSVTGFRGELIITVIDVADEIKDRVTGKKIIGISSITNKSEIKEKLELFLSENNE